MMLMLREDGSGGQRQTEREQAPHAAAPGAATVTT